MQQDRFLDICLTAAQALIKYHRYEVRGMENIPAEGAALIVVNHSLATYDSILLGAEILTQTGRYPLGLADRRIFQTPLISQLFSRLGAVEGTPDAGLRILREGNLLMLSPGGMRESLRPSTRRYHIDWQGRLGFVRLAVQAQVPVVLAACPAADDIFTVYENPLTPIVYGALKWPLPIWRGLGLSPIPRPVKLVHTMHTPLMPPPLRNGKADDRDVRAFHAELQVEMENLLQDGN